MSINGDIVTNFREKPQVDDGWINGGFFVFDKRAFDRVGPNESVSLEEGVLETLAQEGQLGVYQHAGFWQSMDTFREMQLLNEMWDVDNAPWHLWKEHRLSA